MIFWIENSLDSIYENFIIKLQTLAPQVFGGFIIVACGWILARMIYIILMFLFKKIHLNELVDRMKINFDEEKLVEEGKIKKIKEIKSSKNRFTDKVKVDDVVSKATAYYILIVFFRLAISYIGISDVESFLKDVTDYLPNLFIWVLIWFFGIRFANFIYDVVFHTLSISQEKTAKIIAHGARVIILFFTLMVFLDYTKIVSVFIINTILIGFISMVSIAWGLAFWLGGKEIAKEILESFKKN